MRYPIKISGFTLIELMVAMAVAAILIALAAPSFQESIRSNTISTATERLVTSLQLARSEAAERGQSVSVCMSGDQATCSGSWDDGWIVFVDENADGVVDAEDTLVRVEEGVPEGYDITLISPSSTVFGFDGQGFARDSGTFQVCGPEDDDAKAKGVVVRGAGSMRLAVDTDSNGVRERHNGDDFSC